MQRVARWWRRQDRRWGWAWRVGNGLAALLIVATVAIPVFEQFIHTSRYRLNADTLGLVGQTDKTLLKQLTYDADAQTYQFNKDSVHAYDPQAKLQTQVGTAPKSTYALDVPADFAKGVTYHDINSQLDFSLVPQFTALPGKQVSGHLVFPLDGDSQAIYTLKNNGLKEDIVVPQVSGDTMSFSYQLNLPKTLAARVIPDSGGAIGIYSADPSLFGNISYGSDADRTAVEKARERGAKTNLVFGLPAPVIKAADGAALNGASARFELNGTTLRVVAEHLSGVTTPITIDPSVVVTSTSDFQTGGNNDSNIDFSTSDQINRGALTGGSVGSWTTSSQNFAGARGYAASAAYNGYLYLLGGDVSTTVTQYAPINSDGTIGAWANTSSFTTNRTDLSAVVYNGYLYLAGGYNTSTYTTYGDIQYAPINSDGSLGSWQTSATGLPSDRCDFGLEAYNGYLYTIGGYTDTDVTNDVSYAPIHADGTIGSWVSTGSFTTARGDLSTAVYNGYLYILGGNNAGMSTSYSDVQYAPINADGTVGSWATTTALPTVRTNASAVAYNGYLYMMAGRVSGATSSDVLYASINANGTVGSWTATKSLNTGRNKTTIQAYNDYLYIMGGQNSTSTDQSTTEIAKIDPAGITQNWTNDNTHTINAKRAQACAVAYGGRLYVIGGSTSDDGTHNVKTVQYTTLAADGTLGSWSTGTNLPLYSSSMGCAAANGYIYTLGGYTTSSSTSSGSSSGVVYYASINVSTGALGSWSTGTSLASKGTPEAPGVFIYGGYIYSVGGRYSGTGTSATGVYYAPLNTTTGNVGSWATASSLSVDLNNRGYARVGSYLYAFGGMSGSSPRQQTEYAHINANGSLGSWTSGPNLPTATGFNKGTSVNGCMYSLGGENSSGSALNAVFYACPNADGSITSWNSAPNLATATTDMGVAAYNGYIYGVGGWTTGTINSTLYAGVNNGGSGSIDSAWGTTSSLQSSSQLRSVASNGYVYLLNADSSGSYMGKVWYTPINADGSLGSWMPTTTMASAVTYFSPVIVNNYLYVISGFNGSADLTTTQYAPINADGTLGSWQTTTASFTHTNGSLYARDAYVATVYNNTIYIIGGNGGVDTAEVDYGIPNTNGDITAWHTTTSLPSTNYAPAATAYNGYLYVVGGIVGSTPTNSVVYAPINSDGTIGSWTATSSINTPQITSVTAYDGFIYLAGGSDGSNAYDNVQHAVIHSDGTLGSWQSDYSLSTQFYLTAVFAVNGYIYGVPIYPAHVYYHPLNVQARTGHYSKLIDFGSAVNVSGITYNGTLPGGASAISYKAAGSDGVFSQSGKPADITATSPCTTSLPGVRYMFVSVVLDDSTGSAVFPDANGANANLTDITVSYSSGHPPPNIRLRGGQTLQQGSLSALDTCIDQTTAATPQVVQNAQGSSGTGNVSSLTVSLPAATQIGNLIIITSILNNGTLPLPSGFTDLSSGTGMSVYAKVSTTGENSWTLSQSGMVGTWQAFEISGAAMPSQSPASSIASNTTTISSPSPGSLSGSNLVLAFGWAGKSGGGTTGPTLNAVSAGWTTLPTAGTTINSGYNHTLEAAYMEASSGSPICTFTFSTAEDLVGDVVVVPGA